MKTRINLLLLSLLSLSAFAQNEGSIGDMSAASRATRFKVNVDNSNLPFLKIGTTTPLRLALLSDVVAAAGGGVQQVNGLSPTSGNVNITWANLLGKPTSATGLAADAVITGATYANPAFISTLAFSKLTGTPTTRAGYGITDAEPTITSGSALQYIRADKTLATFATDARGSISAVAPLAYNAGTGVTSIPAATASVDGYLTSAAYNLFNGKQSPATTIAGYGITDADPYLKVNTYADMDALTLAANTSRRILVATDERYSKSNQWYMIWSDSGAVMHADKLVTITEK